MGRRRRVEQEREEGERELIRIQGFLNVLHVYVYIHLHLHVQIKYL